MRRESLEGDWDWLAFAADLPSRPIPFTALTTGQVALSGRCLVTGISGVNAATTAGRISIFDGTDSTGVQVWQASGAASSLFTSNVPGKGILCEIGCFLLASTMTATGSVLLIPLWHYDFTPPGE